MQADLFLDNDELRLTFYKIFKFFATGLKKWYKAKIMIHLERRIWLATIIRSLYAFAAVSESVYQRQQQTSFKNRMTIAAGIVSETCVKKQQIDSGSE